MRCQDIREQLSVYIDGMLDSSLEAQVKLHIASCEGCRLEYEDLTTTVQLLKSLPEIAPPPDFNLKLQEKLANLQPQVVVSNKTGLLGRLVRGKWSGPLAAAAVVFLTVGVTALWYDKQHGDMFNPVVQDQIVDDSGGNPQFNNAKSEQHNLVYESEKSSSNFKKKTEAGFGSAGVQKDAPTVDAQPADPGIKAAPNIAPNMKVAPDVNDTSNLNEVPKISIMQSSPVQEADAPHVAREYRATWEPGNGAAGSIGDLAAKYDGIIEYEPQEAGQSWVLRLPDNEVTTFLNDLGKSGNLEVKTDDRDLTDKYHQIESKINELKEMEQRLTQNNDTKELASLQQQIQQQSQAMAELNKETSMALIILTVK
ncbi:DUF4349 domain-containing protein [Desulfotruncus alcoholivorax]|uniref:DUF4349 domain-containing protein n=1 Tax=Desulfotruncus alcoholivorax TaxID=265477 RepID=UPI000427D756|nr:DUF4349 domain-containing protein [Desulfotruncus alcoholivorax]